MKRIPNTISLAQLTLLSLALVTLLVGLMFALIYAESEKAVAKGSDLIVELGDRVRTVEKRVSTFLEEAEELITVVEGAGSDLVAQDEAFEAVLLEQVAKVPGISEVTFISTGGQVSAVMGRDGRAWILRESGDEATKHRTYQTLSRPRFRGEIIWSDLHFSQLDTDLPPEERRVVVTVQKAVWRGERLLGVLRVGRSTKDLDQVGTLTDLPGWTFLCDQDGHLVTRVSPGDPVTELEDRFRVSASAAPQPVAVALRELEKRAQSGSRQWTGKVNTELGDYVVSFRELPGTQDWMVGMVWSQEHFLAPLKEARKKMLLSALVGIFGLVILVLGGLRRISFDLNTLVKATSDMNQLDFRAHPPNSRLRELREVALSVEGAKATLRAAVKYVPIGLVRQLFQQDIEPKLGGSVQNLSLMFTDVAGFTGVSESLEPDELAVLLAEYLDAMNAAVERHEGVQLQRIGDALLVIWNAPERLADHPFKACLAALDCVKSTEHLEWRTRFGLHLDDVMVGHFGSEERMNYGILGDGVNLASRVEGLNKLYGTTILVTDSVVEALAGRLLVREVDRVAVIGKELAVGVYELLGDKKDVSAERLEIARAYEQALQMYRERQFEEALELFASLADDPPAQALRKRCLAYLDSPPPDDWNGSYSATSK